MEGRLGRTLASETRSAADLRHLEAMSGILKEDANALVALLIARSSDEGLIGDAERLYRFFGQVEAQIGAVLDASRS